MKHLKIIGLLFLAVLLDFGPVLGQQLPPFLGPITGSFVTATGVTIKALTGQNVCTTHIFGSGTFTATFLVSNTNDGNGLVAGYTVNSGTLGQVVTASSSGRYITFLGSAKSFQILPGTITGTVSYDITCSNGSVPLPAGATGAPAPTSTAGIPYVQPTNVPTLGVTVQNTPTPQPTPAAVTTTVASSASSVTLLAAATAVNGASFCNNSTQIAYLSMTTPATSSLYFLPIPAAGVVPSCIVLTGSSLYKGTFYAIWASANGTMIVTYW